jgi:hypothetical protein
LAQSALTLPSVTGNGSLPADRNRQTVRGDTDILSLRQDQISGADLFKFDVLDADK